ncbi:MAG: ATP-binding protein [Legionella sp.]|uniref:ATP-binding protein n=1 Tax=Legionella sp. TaxID=459 RepID=UPI0039E2AC71
MFEQYTMLSRAQKHGANFRGVGAGLFLTKQRARLLDAKIRVKSKVGKGSTFIFTIPAKTDLKNS